CQHGYVTPFSF
nr:immunoglobulin light chain junction region [Macaca mulatta]